MYAEPSDVAVELGRPDFTDEAVVAQITAWIARVEASIVRRIPDLADRIADGDLDADIVGNVVAAVVARKVRNPDGTRQTTVAVDDGSVTKLRDGAVWDGDLTLTGEEWDILSPPSAAFSIRPSGTVSVSFYPDRWPLRGC